MSVPLDSTIITGSAGRAIGESDPVAMGAIGGVAGADGTIGESDSVAMGAVGGDADIAAGGGDMASDRARPGAFAIGDVAGAAAGDANLTNGKARPGRFAGAIGTDIVCVNIGIGIGISIGIGIVAVAIAAAIVGVVSVAEAGAGTSAGALVSVKSGGIITACDIGLDIRIEILGVGVGVGVGLDGVGTGGADATRAGGTVVGPGGVTRIECAAGWGALAIVGGCSGSNIVIPAGSQTICVGSSTAAGKSLPASAISCRSLTA